FGDWSWCGDFFSLLCKEKVTYFMEQAMKCDISEINCLLRSQFISEVTAGTENWQAGHPYRRRFMNRPLQGPAVWTVRQNLEVHQQRTQQRLSGCSLVACGLRLAASSRLFSRSSQLVARSWLLLQLPHNLTHRFLQLRISSFKSVF